MGSSSSSERETCPRCNVNLPIVNLVEHMKSCCKVYINLTTGEFRYEGSDRGLQDQLNNMMRAWNSRNSRLT